MRRRAKLARNVRDPRGTRERRVGALGRGGRRKETSSCVWRALRCCLASGLYTLASQPRLLPRQFGAAVYRIALPNLTATSHSHPDSAPRSKKARAAPLALFAACAATARSRSDGVARKQTRFLPRTKAPAELPLGEAQKNQAAATNQPVEYTKGRQSRCGQWEAPGPVRHRTKSATIDQ